MGQEIRRGMVLSPRIETQSLRLSESVPGFEGSACEVGVIFFNTNYVNDLRFWF